MWGNSPFDDPGFSKHCKDCEIRWPAGYKKCPTCGIGLSLFSPLPPDPDWREHEGAAVAEREGWNIPRLRADTPIIRDGQRDWITTAVLVDQLTYDQLKGCPIVEIREELWEIIGRDNARRRYYVEKVVFLDDLPVLDDNPEEGG